MWDTDNPWTERAVESLRNQFSNVTVPVFFFRGGQTLILASDEAARLSLNRCRTKLADLNGFCVIDWEGEAASNKDSHRWESFGNWDPVRGG